MSDIAIRVENLGKRYKLGRVQGPAAYRTLREELVQVPGRLWSALSAKASDEEDFWALRDISFEVKQGEVLGVIGHNGAGKSTLLKILSRIVEPTAGLVDLYGRVGSLLEVGTGFHPELTGRENIFLSGAMLGMRRAEVRARMDEIVAFAEVERFLDTPCKHYSSGMYMRLGFAVAAHLEAEILVVDEVLAVGDAEFQKRCLNRMETVVNSFGRTVLFVSHNITAIRRLCSRAVYLKSGRLAAHGTIDEVVRCYDGGKGAAPTEIVCAVASEKICAIEAVRVEGTRTADKAGFLPGHPMKLAVQAVLSCTLRSVQVAVRISTSDGVPVLTSSNFDMQRRSGGLFAGRHLFSLELPPLFAPGEFKVTVALCDPQRELYDVLEDRVGFTIDRFGSLGMDLNDNRRGCVELILPWEHELVP